MQYTTIHNIGMKLRGVYLVFPPTCEYLHINCIHVQGGMFCGCLLLFILLLVHPFEVEARLVKALPDIVINISYILLSYIM